MLNLLISNSRLWQLFFARDEAKTSTFKIFVNDDLRSSVLSPRVYRALKCLKFAI